MIVTQVDFLEARGGIEPPSKGFAILLERRQVLSIQQQFRSVRDLGPVLGQLPVYVRSSCPHGARRRTGYRTN
jgi:hypothetical protein